MINSKVFFLGYLLTFCVHVKSQTSLPNVITGRIVRIEDFASKYITPRNIDIWLPQGYSDAEKYSVLYMQDGQMLFDSSKSWNKQSWEVDDVATTLMENHQIKNVIVVGIWNGGPTRHPDYFPQKPFEQMLPIEKDTVTAQLIKAGRVKDVFKPQSDDYLKFLVKELKPYIDSHFSVYTNSSHTFIAGSSMGGLISIYAICEYPQIFGGAAGISTHWTGTFVIENNPFPNSMIKYLTQFLPDPKNHRIYFDCGNKTLDALYPPIQMRIDSLMVAKGYQSSNWLTKYYPGEDHSERSWSKRLAIPLLFLLKN